MVAENVTSLTTISAADHNPSRSPIAQHCGNQHDSRLKNLAFESKNQREGPSALLRLYLFQKESQPTRLRS
jgi:hypothetical protein